MVGDESAGVFAGYQIEGLIRHGGMASVYRARHLVLQRPAALNVLIPAMAHDDRFRARFLGESRTAASLDHPHIVPIYDAGESGGALYIAMRLIEGSDLGTVLETEARLEPRRAVDILGQVAGALDDVVATAMAKRPDDRYATCTALIDAARAALDAPRRSPAAPVFVPSTRAVATAGAAVTAGPAARRGWRRRWPALLAGAAALLLVGVIGAGALRGSASTTPPPVTGGVPLPVDSPLPLPRASPAAPPAGSATAAPHSGAPIRAVVVTVNASPPAATHPTAAPTSRATAGPPTPTGGPATPAPTASPAPTPTAAWP